MKAIVGMASMFTVSALILVLAISPNTQSIAQNVIKSTAVSGRVQLQDLRQQPHLKLAGFGMDGTVTTDCVNSDPNHESLYYTQTCCPPPDGQGDCVVFNRKHAVEAQCPGGGYNCGTFDPPITGILTSTWEWSVVVTDPNGNQIWYNLGSVECVGEGPC